MSFGKDLSLRKNEYKTRDQSVCWGFDVLLLLMDGIQIDTYLVREILLLVISGPLCTHCTRTIFGQWPTNILGPLIWNYSYDEFFLIAVARDRRLTKGMLTISIGTDSAFNEVVAVRSTWVHTRVFCIRTSNPPGSNADVVIDTFAIDCCSSDEWTACNVDVLSWQWI